MINIAICDDEVKQRHILKSILKSYLNIHNRKYNIFEYDSGEALHNEFNSDKNKIDIIFLDIELKNMNGMDTARRIRKLNEKCIIIFVTAYSDYVFDGYEVRALNYIVKPYSDKKITSILEQALKQLEKVINEYFSFMSNNALYKIPIKDIMYFKSNRRKIFIITDYKTYEFYGKLNSIEKKLESNFTRTHQRYLVNLNHITSIKNDIAIVRNESIPVSKHRHKAVMIKFAKYLLIK